MLIVNLANIIVLFFSTEIMDEIVFRFFGIWEIEASCRKLFFMRLEIN